VRRRATQARYGPRQVDHPPQDPARSLLRVGPMGPFYGELKMMKLTLLGAALALAFGTAQAADKNAKHDSKPNVVEKQQEKGGALNNDTSFRVLDKNNDGYLSKAEAAGNPDLAKRFKEADDNNDGKLS